MASANLILVLTIFFMIQATATSNDFSLAPLFSPFLDDVCKIVECGKGTCLPSRNSSLLFTCECDHGWKQSRASDEDHLDFLPCIIPNCTLDYSCSAAQAPQSYAEARHLNDSLFDPCYWSYCGGGRCNRVSTFTHTCDCEQGYNNLLNISAMPCFKQCAVGMDCKTLGIGGLNDSSSISPPSFSDNGNNQGNTCESVDCKTFGVGGFNHSSTLTPPTLPDIDNDRVSSEASTIASKLINWVAVSIMCLAVVS